MTDTTNNDSIFSTSTTDTSAPELIGEGKKYKDIMAADKALKDKDAFIESLKREAAEARQEVKQRMSLEELWEKTQKAKETPPSSISTPSDLPVVDEQEDKTNKNVNIADLVKKALAVELTKAKQQDNIETARKELEKVWGGDYVDKLKSTVEKLGLGKDFIDDIAARSPTAFLALVGVNSQAPSQGNPNSQVPPQGNSRTTSLSPNTNGARNEEYYKNLKKEHPQDYFSREVQLQRHKDALAMGEKFFSV